MNEIEADHAEGKETCQKKLSLADATFWFNHDCGADAEDIQGLSGG
jgi:hypothetical protein